MHNSDPVRISGPNALSAVEAARQIAAGSLSSEALVTACIDRILERDNLVRAWVCVDTEGAQRAARACDASAATGPLHGVPVAVKDVIDVHGLPTEMGSPIYAGYHPLADASCVALLRAAGAVILGKTVTAEFAGIAAGPTRNPLSPTRTPGGSSSGSAAAVADYMVPIAFGTQTGGSILRPASYCGVLGFKPSYNTVNRAGLKFAAESFDTIGHLARSVEDIDLVWRVLTGQPQRALPDLQSPPRLALFLTHYWHRASPETVAAIASVTTRLAADGIIVEDIAVPDGFEILSDARRTINNYERARAMSWEWHNRRDEISPQLSQVIADGSIIKFEDYVEAKKLVEHWRHWFAAETHSYDAVLTPAADGEALEGIESTGSSAFQEVWTMLHVPAISLPLAQGPNGLPVGVQFVGKLHRDNELLALSKWLMDRLSVSETIPNLKHAYTQ